MHLAKRDVPIAKVETKTMPFENFYCIAKSTICVLVEAAALILLRVNNYGSSIYIVANSYSYV